MVLAVSSDGRVFQALFRSGGILVLDRHGGVIGFLETGPETTNCVFARDGKKLYITADHSLKTVTIPEP
jgi:sugar lactone lactonase YvrE